LPPNIYAFTLVYVKSFFLVLFFLAKQGFLSHFSFVDTKAFYPPFNSCKEMQKNKNRFFMPYTHCQSPLLSA